MKRLKTTTLFSVIAALMFITFTACETTDDEISYIDLYGIDMNNLSYAQVASGQTTLYDDFGSELASVSEGDAFYGQDANYLKGESMSYQNNGDGTITDMNTGLMWQQIPIPDGLTWGEAIEYCENLELAGYSDWRMPNIKELFSISNFGMGWPYLDTTYFSLATGIIDKSEQYWSSNFYAGVTVEGQDSSAFGVNHVTGHIKTYPASSAMSGGGDMPSSGMPQGTDTVNGGGMPGGEMPGGGMPTDTVNGGGQPGGMPGDMPGGTAPNGGVQVMSSPFSKHVRAVRGTEYGINDFKDNGDGTITDAATGLMWTQDDSGEGLDWESALAYAENAEIAGHTDWRLPNVKELQAIVDYRYAPGACDAANEGAAIDPDYFTCTPIVNEAGDDDYGYFWTGTSANFTSCEPYYYAWYVAFGRAVNDAGEDYHGAGGVRFDTKVEGGPLGEGGERYYNYVRLVRDIE